MIDEEVDSSNLHGEAFKAKPVQGESSVGSGHQTLYCEFVDAFSRVSPQARAVAISEAQDEWRKARSNPADVRRRIDERSAMAQKAKCGLDGILPSLPVPSHLRHPTDRRLIDSDRPHRPQRRPRLLARMPPCRPIRLSSALSSRKLVLSRPHHVDRTFISWSAKNFFHGAYMHLMCVFVWRGGGGVNSNEHRSFETKYR